MYETLKVSILHNGSRLRLVIILYIWILRIYQKAILALAVWSCGIVSACGVMGREIESRHGVGGCFYFRNKTFPERLTQHMPLIRE
jgi:hypothetical protein